MKNPKEMNRVLANIRASMAIEGFNATEEEEDNVLLILSGKINGEELIRDTVKEFRKYGGGVAKSYQDGWDKKYCYPESSLTSGTPMSSITMREKSQCIEWH